MRTLTEAEDVRHQSRAWRAAREAVGFVPTMGALHEGHLRLVDAARAAGAGRVVVSIFVNPTQFGPTEDLQAYPRDPEGDARKLAERGVDLLFAPLVPTIYPADAETAVSLSRLPAHLCGLSRPVHFGGVATVVTLLFNIVEPAIAVFGEKDFQQLQVIRKLVRDLHMPVRIVGAPIVREPDGLAMSSRNAYLDPSARARARCLYRSLERAAALAAAGVVSAREITREMAAICTAAGGEVDYASVVDEETLDDVETISRPVRAVLAVRIGRARLIDNRRLVP